ncbi:ABC transporter permease [Streptococcus sp. FT1-106]|uniref:ABC transporter permease n=1 Tax=Streptococcus sp. FT1-106 TaxID=3409994 RepID=UPI003BF5211D
MTKLFQKRRSAFINQCLKYLRYVLNDHFVLVLVFFMGFLMFQYSSLLKNFPSNHFPIIVILVVTIAVLLSVGQIASYLEPADKQFLLTKEAELTVWIGRAKVRSFVIWGMLQTVVLVLLAPIFFQLGLSVIGFIIVVGILLMVKYFIMQAKSRVFFDDGRLAWDRAIAYEMRRKQSILKFYSLFTNVKGISSSVKRRSYLDGFLAIVKKNSAKLWSNLYLRAFLRSSDYLALTLRLFLLSVLALIFVSNRLIAIGLTLTFDYLLIFQLLALYHHFDYQYLVKLYPISGETKAKNLQSFLEKLLYLLAVFQLFLTLSWQAGVILIVAILIITKLYLPYKIKTMID